MGKRKYDWLTIRREYVDSPTAVSKTELAKKYGMALDTIVRKSLKEHWEADRERFIMRVNEQSMENKAQSVASEGRDFDRVCLDSANRILSQIVHKLDVFERAQREAQAEGRNATISAREATELGRATQVAQAIGKAALGDKPVERTGANVNLMLSVEDVLRKYAEAGSSPVPSTDSAPE